ncbi:MAG: hypothetical protein ACFE8L_06155 [Candidatus Hodarchaeota archaeon]
MKKDNRKKKKIDSVVYGDEFEVINEEENEMENNEISEDREYNNLEGDNNDQIYD